MVSESFYGGSKITVLTQHYDLLRMVQSLELHWWELNTDYTDYPNEMLSSLVYAFIGSYTIGLRQHLIN